MGKLSFLLFILCVGVVVGLRPVAAESPYLNSKASVSGQYLRIELPGNLRMLTLAEVEVYSDGQNIAGSGRARQSSVMANGVPERAMDGNKDPIYAKGGQTHTSEERNPWWELDLGKETPIHAVSIWNRGNDYESRLDGFTLQVLDSGRKKRFEITKVGGAAGSIHLRMAGNGSPVYHDHNGKVTTPKPSAARKGDGWRGDTSDSVFWSRRDPVAVPDRYKDPVPFAFQKGDTIALIGNALGERFQHHGDIEAPVQSTLRGMELSFRNMCLSGDRVGQYPRSSGFTPMDAYLQHVAADVIFCFFGYNESYEDEPDDYTEQLIDYVNQLRSYQPNGESFPRIVLFSPIAHEDLGDRNLPNGKDNNRRLAKYTEATRSAAAQSGVTFVDLFSETQRLYQAHEEPLTINGIHLNQAGGALVGRYIAETLLGKAPAEVDSDLAKLIADKNWHWFNRYRATDGNDVWGSRSKLKFVDNQTNAEVLQHELIMIDQMVANRDRAIWAAAKGENYAVSDSNVDAPVQVISNVGGHSASSSAVKEGSLEYLSGSDGLAQLSHPAGYKVNLYADESMFPELANPVQMQVDGKGRIWAAVWPTYPKWEPLKEMNDALVILEDTDGDGVADQCKEFARVHNPVGFEFWNGGVLVTSQPDLIFLKDTDGDDVADERHVILHGFGSSDTHHSANNLIYGPDGGIYWQSGIFLMHNHEHPWGPSLQTDVSAMFRFDPRRFTVAYHAANTPNPHGIAFDNWGYHYSNDGTGGRSYQVRPDEHGFKMHMLLNKEVRPVTANAIVSSANFPADVQGNFLVCNTIGFLGVKNYKLHREGYERPTAKRTVTHRAGEAWGTPEEDLLVSKDGNFRPTDAVFGADGALYVSDWSNVIIGHMQHNVRDPNRDHSHGRIYRMAYESRPLQEPVSIDGEPLDRLMVNLEHPIDGVRHRTRVELSERDSDEVIAAAKKWVDQWEPKNPDHAHHLLEGLWVHQQHNVRDLSLLQTVLESPVEHARIAAATVRHHWEVVDPAKGAIEIEEEEEMSIIPGGVISDTPELTTLRINTLVEQLRYDVKELEVTAGKPVKLTFANPDALPHNLVIVKPGTADAVATAAIALGADGFQKQFVPESEDILHHTAMLDIGQSEELAFTAPTTPGDYQFVCTFPGHAQLMRGVLRVKSGE